jgi:hypothetical protein
VSADTQNLTKFEHVDVGDNSHDGTLCSVGLPADSGTPAPAGQRRSGSRARRSQQRAASAERSSKLKRPSTPASAEDTRPRKRQAASAESSSKRTRPSAPASAKDTRPRNHFVPPDSPHALTDQHAGVIEELEEVFDFATDVEKGVGHPNFQDGQVKGFTLEYAKMMELVQGILSRRKLPGTGKKHPEKVLDPVLVDMIKFTDEEDRKSHILSLWKRIDLTKSGGVSLEEFNIGLKKIPLRCAVQLSKDDFDVITNGGTMFNGEQELTLEAFQRMMRARLLLFKKEAIKVVQRLARDLGMRIVSVKQTKQRKQGLFSDPSYTVTYDRKDHKEFGGRSQPRGKAFQQRVQPTA